MNYYGQRKPFDFAENKTYHLIYHPMIVENPERAILSIGGFKKFAKIIEDSRSMLLRLQPENEYHAGIFNDRPKVGKTTIQLLAKIQRNKRTGALRTKILGVIRNAYHFNSLCDFQFLPLEKDSEAENCFTDVVSQIVPGNMADALSWWERPPLNEDSLAANFLPPFIFSRYTKPANRLLTPEETLFKDVPPLPAETEEILAVNRRPERKSFALIVQSTDEFPTEPAPGAIEDVNQRCRPQEPHDLLQNLFEKRPMWTRPAILANTKLEDGLLKAMLPKFAFYIGSGPYGRCWCKFGYDPKKTPEAKAYQTISVSFRLNDQIPEKLRLKICGRTTVSNASKSAEEPSSFEYKFIAGSLPHHRQMWYCVCDIQLPVAENVMKTDMTEVVPTFDATSGWLTTEIIETIREEIKSNVLQSMTASSDNTDDDAIPEEEESEADEDADDIF